MRTGMRRFNFTVFLLTLVVAFAIPNVASAIEPCMTGAWYDADDPGRHEGINVEVLSEDNVLVYFYTYAFFDRSQQNWLVFTGPENDMTAYDVVPFGFEPIEYEVGTGSLMPVDNNTMIFRHSFLLELDQQAIDDPASPWCLNGGCDETYVYTRLTQPIPCPG